MTYTGTIQQLIDRLGKLPGIGPKSAQRVAFHLLKIPRDEALLLSEAIVEAKNNVRACKRCFNLAESGEECAICVNPRREPQLVCVVEDSQDIAAIERTQEFRGRYHVLGGAFSPIDGVGADQLRVRELLSRIADEGIAEVIVATNPNLEGEATAALLVKYLKPLGVRVTRLAMGLPIGGDLEYADELTLRRAIEGRKAIHENVPAPQPATPTHQEVTPVPPTGMPAPQAGA